MNDWDRFLGEMFNQMSMITIFILITVNTNWNIK